MDSSDRLPVGRYHLAVDYKPGLFVQRERSFIMGPDSGQRGEGGVGNADLTSFSLGVVGGGSQLQQEFLRKS